MKNNLYEYVQQQFVSIPSGTELIRDYRVTNKWLSANHQLAMPGSRKGHTEKIMVVEVHGFYLDKLPVTESLYNTILNNEFEITLNDRKPVTNVSWLDAIKFCNSFSIQLGLKPAYEILDDTTNISCDWSANGFRLPTDAEWQYACKANINKYSYGRLEDIAWYKGNSDNKIHPVGLKQPNLFGLYDMIGNVWEWCWDLYDIETYGEYRIFRGGSWAEEERGCGSTSRRRGHPTFTIDDLGFRLARSIL
ncbi:formylglycine-generating enzyme family protein [Paenisporosarcina sp. FSL H8-0542]|uniref:formylglycine-generating enzyme family protein n=1 Tax=unclassified Paenisporosarcina TaxID=2642018 RepID=UPI00034E4AF8|nr:formylglycine-generating enzyme family protein [Paenisporosarcina sp. HGH0030]EPD53846.1 hypothetical protein HMPREF1210_00669 [Paenisporosarcina sp. HGH0030]